MGPELNLEVISIFVPLSFSPLQIFSMHSQKNSPNSEVKGKKKQTQCAKALFQAPPGIAVDSNKQIKLCLKLISLIHCF